MKHDLVLCTITENEESMQKKKKVSFASDVKFNKNKHSALLSKSETCMMCTIDGKSFFMFTKHIWIRDSGDSCHTIKNDKGMYAITNIDESIQGSSGNMKATKMDMLCVMVRQVDGSEILHTLWSMKYCKESSAHMKKGFEVSGFNHSPHSKVRDECSMQKLMVKGYVQ